MSKTLVNWMMDTSDDNSSSEMNAANASLLLPSLILGDMAMSHPSHPSPESANGVLFESPKGMWIIIDGIISILAILANVAFIGAIRNVKLDLKGYRVFLINLSATNIFTAFVCLLNFVQQTVASYSHSMIMEKCASSFLRSLNIASMLSNLFSLFGMSIDHYVGIVHPLRYHQIMGRSRFIKAAVAGVWIISMLSALVDTLLIFMAYDESTRRTSELPASQLTATRDSPAVPDIMAALVKNSQPETTTPLPVPIADNTQQFFQPFTLIRSNPIYIDGINAEEVEVITNSREINESLVELDVFPQGAFWEGEVGDPVAHFMKMFISNDSETIAAYFDRILHNDEVYLVSWCSYYASETLWFELIVIGLTVLIFMCLVPIYYQTLRQMVRARVEQDWNARKLVITTLFLLGAFLLCRVPFVLFEVTMVILMRIGYMRTNDSYLFTMLMNNALNSLLMLYPLMDPIIYTIRMRAVRRYFLWRLRKILPVRYWRADSTGGNAHYRDDCGFSPSRGNSTNTCIDGDQHRHGRAAASSCDSAATIRPLIAPARKVRQDRPSFVPLTSYVTDAAISVISENALSEEERRRSSSRPASIASGSATPQPTKRRRKSSIFLKPLLDLNRRLSLLLFDQRPTAISGPSMTDVATSTNDDFGLRLIPAFNTPTMLSGIAEHDFQTKMKHWSSKTVQRQQHLAAVGSRDNGHYNLCKQYSKSMPDFVMVMKDYNYTKNKTESVSDTCNEPAVQDSEIS